MSTFFSVCVDATNRQSTILNTLESIRCQDFTDYEVIICDASLDSDCFDRVMKWLEEFGDSRFKFFKTSLSHGEGEITNWNNPIDRATGKFISMLEGDDSFNPSHLSGAFHVLQESSDVVLYFSRGTSNSNYDISIKPQFEYTYHQNKDLLLSLLKFDWCPVPSTTIFPRLIGGLPIKYSEEAFWAAEYYLYYYLLKLPGAIVIESPQITVYRTPSEGIRNSFHLKDADFFLAQHHDDLTSKQLRFSQRKLKLWAIDYLYQNAKLGLFDAGSMRIVLRFARKLEFLFIFLRFVFIWVSRIRS